MRSYTADKAAFSIYSNGRSLRINIPNTQKKNVLTFIYIALYHVVVQNANVVIPVGGQCRLFVCSHAAHVFKLFNTFYEDHIYYGEIHGQL